MKALSAWLRNRRGASSVLVIFMMIVLVVLGILAFTAAYANLSLSRKTASHLQSIYTLDDQAEECVQAVEAALISAEQRACDAFAAGRFPDDLGAGDRVDDLQASLAAAKAANDTAMAQALFARTYYAFADSALETLCAANESISFAYDEAQDFMFSDDFLNLDLAEPEVGALRVSVHISRGEEVGRQQLDVLLEVRSPAYELSFAGEGLKGARERGAPLSHMRTAAWKHWQIPFTYAENVDFNDRVIPVK